MRVLWLDAEQNPWTDADGFAVLESFGVSVERVQQAKIAKEKIQNPDFDVLVASAETPGALDLLPEARLILSSLGKKIILCSSQWTKDDFKRHAKTNGAANRYARLPMPADVFLKEVAGLLGCAVEELGNYPAPPSLELPSTELPPPELATQLTIPGLSSPSGLESLQPEAISLSQELNLPPLSPPPSPARQHQNSPEEEDVLRKYLRLREEQLELLTSERDELHQDNQRLQKEVERLQKSLRDSEMARGTLAKQAEHADAERSGIEETNRQEKERFEVELRAAQEKLKTLDGKLKESEDRYEGLKARVRKDIRKIRANEKDLEARLDILRKDSETLLAAREQKLLELQRKIDALEFDLDQVQDSRVQAEMVAERYLAKLSRVARALHIAAGVIEEDQSADEELDELEPILGGAAAGQESAVPPAEETVATPPQEAAGTDVLETKTTAAEPDGAKPEDLYASLAADGEPTRVADINELKASTDDSGNEAVG